MACHPPHNNVRGESRKELVMNWISVKERLPELPKGISVRKFLCVTTSGEGHYTVDGVTFWDMDNLFVVRPQKGSKPYWGANPKKQPEPKGISYGYLHNNTLHLRGVWQVK